MYGESGPFIVFSILKPSGAGRRIAMTMHSWCMVSSLRYCVNRCVWGQSNRLLNAGVRSPPVEGFLYLIVGKAGRLRTSVIPALPRKLIQVRLSLLKANVSEKPMSLGFGVPGNKQGTPLRWYALSLEQRI